MDANTLLKNVGKQGTLSIPQSSMSIKVRILNARKMWDRMDYLVTPLCGAGAQWVAASRIIVDETNENRAN